MLPEQTSDKIAVFEATHGTAPNTQERLCKSRILFFSAEMMLRHIGWTESADLIVRAMESTISDGKVTYDFARLMPTSQQVSCSEFGSEIVKRM